MQLRGAQQLPSCPQDGQSKTHTLVGVSVITPTRPPSAPARPDHPIIP